MGILQSDLFKNDTKLEQCAILPNSHVLKPAIGDHVRKIQEALIQLDNATIDSTELAQKRYGNSTAAAVLAYKRKRSIINPAYQRSADDIVGVMTIKAMDAELHGSGGPAHSDVINRAFNDSRASLRVVQRILRTLAADIAEVEASVEPQKTAAMATFLIKHARDVLVLSRRLLVPADAFSPAFKRALTRTQGLVDQNLNQPQGIRDDGAAGRCLATNFTPPGVPFAGTQASDPQPRVSVCTPFFAASRELQRDVLTHEYFHLLGLQDISVNNTDTAFRNANTLAQVVAFLHDRFRQANSDGNERAIPALPSP